MKRLLAFAWLLIFVLTSCSDDKNDPIKPDAGKGIKFAVIADPHVFDNSLGATSQAFVDYRNQFPCLFDKSEEILKCAVDDIIADKSITHVIALGGLTMRGEKASMVKFLAQMKRLEDAGRIVIAMPGDLDFSGEAKSYTGNKELAAENATLTWYESAGKDFEAPSLVASTDLYDMKVYEPVAGYWFLLLGDANPIDSEGQEWIKNKLQEAKQKGKEVIVFMTHNVVPHFVGQDFNTPNKYVDYLPVHKEFKSPLYVGHKEFARMLDNGGVQLVFTAGAHATNTAQISGGQLWEVATGSLCAVGNIYRIVRINEKGETTISAEQANASWNKTTVDEYELYLDFYMKDFFPTWLSYVVENSDYSYSACSAYSDVFALSIYSHILGNEEQLSEAWNNSKYVEFQNDFPGNVAKFLYNITHDPDGNYPTKADHELNINLK